MPKEPKEPMTWPELKRLLDKLPLIFSELHLNWLMEIEHRYRRLSESVLLYINERKKKEVVNDFGQG